MKILLLIHQLQRKGIFVKANAGEAVALLGDGNYGLIFPRDIVSGLPDRFSKITD